MRLSSVSIHFHHAVVWTLHVYACKEANNTNQLERTVCQLLIPSGIYSVLIL